MGLNFDFVVLNLTKHSSYLLYNASLYFSPSVQKQYKAKFGENEVSSLYNQLIIANLKLITFVSKNQSELHLCYRWYL